jgi:iron complex transport system ATP-binding protein
VIEGAVPEGRAVRAKLPPMTVLELDAVTCLADGRAIVDEVTWSVQSGERWVILGRNGCGKSTLLRVASLYLHPSRGSVRVLGETLGHTDVRRLRRRIGFAAASFADMLRPALSAADIVMTAKNAALEPWWHTYDDADRARAHELLGRVHIEHLAGRTFGTLSSGERQRVLIARTLMTDPALVLLDEPNAGLDLVSREELVHSLDALASDPSLPPMVLVTHHVEEIPSQFTHGLLMRDGAAIAQGPIADIITTRGLSDCLGIAVSVERRNGRFSAFAE